MTPENSTPTDVIAIRDDNRETMFSRVRPLFQTIGLVLIIVGTIVLGYRFGNGVSQLPVMLTASRLDFGKPWADSKFQWDLVIHNSGSQKAKIEGFRSSCRCTKIEPESIDVPAHGQANIKLSIDLSPRDQSEAAEFVRDFEVSVTPVVKAMSIKPWRVHGQILAPIIATPSHADFGSTCIKDVSFAPMTVKLTPAFKAKNITAKCDALNAGVTVNRDASDGNSFLLRISPNSGLPTGYFRFPVQIMVEDESGKNLPPYPFYALGEVVTDIYSLPCVVDFGVVAKQQQKQCTITLQSRLGTKFHIVSAESSHVGVRSKIHPKEFAVRHSLDICGVFQSDGSKTAELIVKTKAETGVEATILSIPVRAYISNE